MRNNLVIDVLVFKDKKAFGYQEYLFNLLDYFFDNREKLNFSKIIIACTDDQKNHFEKYSSKFEIEGFPVTSKFKHLIQQNLIFSKLNLSKNDVILFTYNYSCLTKRCKHVLVIHDLLFLRKNFLPNKFMRWQRKFYLPVSIRNANEIIAISDFTKKDILEHYKKSQNKVNTIYNYFNFEKKYANICEYSCCEKPYFLSICSTAPHKNTITVLKAFNEYCKNVTLYDLVLVGSLRNETTDCFKYYSSLSENVKKRIHLTKNLSNDQIGELYRNASLFILLTLFEGLGMPIVEAMWFNIPLLVSDIDVCKEVTCGNGKFVSPFDYEAAASILEHFSKKPFFVSTKILLEKMYAAENTTEKYISLLNSLIGENNYIKIRRKGGGGGSRQIITGILPLAA